MCVSVCLNGTREWPKRPVCQARIDFIAQPQHFRSIRLMPASTSLLLPCDDQRRQHPTLPRLAYADSSRRHHPLWLCITLCVVYSIYTHPNRTCDANQTIISDRISHCLVFICLFRIICELRSNAYIAPGGETNARIKLSPRVNMMVLL